MGLTISLISGKLWNQVKNLKKSLKEYFDTGVIMPTIVAKNAWKMTWLTTEENVQLLPEGGGELASAKAEAPLVTMSDSC